MLKAIFLGSKNVLTNMLIHWLSQRVKLEGVVWVPSWQETYEGRLKFARERWRRYGLFKTLDEVLFFVYFNTFLKQRGHAAVLRNLYEPYWSVHGLPTWRGDALTAHDVNAPEVLAFVGERDPDVAFANCIYCYFGKGIRSIPKHGVFVWHEGITPEYKGLYSPFWAVHNLDFARIGYTLLRMNERLDAGEIFIQGTAVDVDPYRDPHSYIGHKAVADSLPRVEQFLEELERGAARPTRRLDAEARYYTLPGLSDYLRQQFRLRRLRRRTRAGRG